MKSEYTEGPEVAEKFEEAMKILFQTSKAETEEKKPKAIPSRKPKD